MATVTIEKTENYILVKIPIKAIKDGRAELSNRARKVIDSAIEEGISDLEAGRVFGPFKSIKAFKRSLART
ncbi:MAG: hypothetical protein Q8P07_00830 [bacterium]|nr:hypothetical protein [bacterium]